LNEIFKVIFLIMTENEPQLNDIETLFLEKKMGDFEVFNEVPNRASFFGDGIFETFVFTNGKIRFGNFHIDRAINGCNILGLESKLLSTLDQLESLLFRKFQNKSIRVRWNIYRNGLGKYSPGTSELRETILIQPLIKAPECKNSAFISSLISVPNSPWSQCKTLNGLIYVMAGKERIAKGMDEVILLNPNGNICEAGSSNLFWIKNDVFFTPSLASNCISGVARRVILDALRIHNYKCIEGEFFPSDLVNADHIFTSNVTGISSILNLEERNYEPLSYKFLFDLFQ